MGLFRQSAFHLLPAVTSGPGGIVLGCLSRPGPSGTHLVPFDGTALTGFLVQLSQGLEGGLFTDPPLRRLHELEDPDAPSLVPAAQSQTEGRR